MWRQFGRIYQCLCLLQGRTFRGDLPSEQSAPAVRPVLSGTGAILPSERRNTMRKLLVALTLMSASLSTAAFAQAGRGTDAEQKACTRDVQKFCRPVIDQGDFTVLACLKENRAKISQACDQVLKNHNQ